MVSKHPPPTTVEPILEAVEATLQAADYCFLSTIGLSGRIDTRLMQHFQPQPDLTLWFGTSAKSRKVRDIRNNSQVTVAFYDPADTAYVTLNGAAQIVSDTDLQQKYWVEQWITFYPTGPEGEDYVLIKFVPSRIEVMNFARHITPEPYGLRPAILTRAEGNWTVASGEPGGDNSATSSVYKSMEV